MAPTPPEPPQKQPATTLAERKKAMKLVLLKGWSESAAAERECRGIIKAVNRLHQEFKKTVRLRHETSRES